MIDQGLERLELEAVSLEANMFITEDQLKERLNSPKNLANRFKRGKLLEDRPFPDRNLLEDNDATESGSPTISQETQSRWLENQESKCVNIEHKEIRRPGNNRPWLSQQERNQIAISFANGNETQTEIALRHHVEVSTVSDIVNNHRRVENSPRSVDQAKLDHALDKVREAAIDRLMSGLGNLTDDKISALGAKETSIVCANMAKVVQQTIPQEKSAQQINLIVYTPELRKEQNFDSVEV